MLAKDIRPGMVINDEGKARQVLETPFPCSPKTKIHAKTDKGTLCYDRLAEVTVTHA